ncbi:DinB family protein [Hymenobacter lapidiphilus]|uniref:DinB family protein n=1 Tax=Hymenobacter sp. CCM 8763 TaxID=2303334 RepID=UPI000E344EFE|nr:DinB family protein [Hymenobacter sp. CCM 8763]RFP65579.1 DinB family protein [Hymenobacter sp. CCM 8763]
MNHRLHLRLEHLERATNHLLATVEAMGERATVAPGPEQWSAAQVVQHLLVAETGVGQYIEKKLREADKLQQTGVVGFLKSRLLRLALRLPGLRFKVPRYLAELTPAEVPTLPELRTQWDATRRHLERLLNEYPGKLLSRAIFKHPRSGMLTIHQTLDFMLDHVLHHQKQVERIAAAVNKLEVRS